MSVEDYEAEAARIEQRWGFLVPWCKVLQPRVYHYYDSSTELFQWEVSEIVLSVAMPRRRGIHDEHDKDEATFRRQFREVREAMALLVAVQHVDDLAYSHLMMEHCGVSVGDYGDELDDAPIASEFVVDLDVGAKEVDGAVTYDLARLCGTDHRLHPSEEYLETLRKIAALDDKLKPGESGVEVDVAVKLRCTRWSSTRDRSIANILLDVAKSEKEIDAQWKEFDKKTEEQDVAEGETRCEFVLKPMHADLRGIHLNLEATQAFEHLFAKSVCFSDIVMTMAYERGDGEDDLVSKRAYGQLLRSFFDSTRRTVDVGHMPYYIELESPGDSQPTQVGFFKIMCDTTMPARDFEALCSAMTLTQTTKKLSLQLIMDRKRQASYEHWWKWLAYALFSKRAQACSSIESVIIPGLEQLTAAEVRAFTSIVTSEHPEETLFGTPRGVVDERDATLTSGAPIRWQFDDEGQPVLDPQLLTLETSIPFVRTFSDDGEREWVNVLVPGFGRCQVQRWNLEFHDTNEDKSGSPALASLAMELYLNNMALVDGVVPFYETIESSLKFLKIHGPSFAGPHDVSVNTIIRSCPNLQELTLSRALVGLEFDLRSYRASNTPIPELNIPWIDVVQLAKDLSDPNNELTKCVRRLRASVETLPLPIPDGEPVIPPRFQVSVDSLLSMLKANERLEYVKVQAEYTDTLGDFIKYDMKPIYRQGEPFPIKCKAALLSVTQSRDMQAEGEKKRKVGAVQPKLALGQMDPHVLSNIFAFAAEPILRRVFFDQIKYGNHEHHEHHHHHHQHQQEEQE